MTSWKQRARNRIAAKLRSHKLKKPHYCEACQLIKPLETHHWDYNVDDFVSYLCGRCHRKLDTVEYIGIKKRLREFALARAFINRRKERRTG